MSKKEELLYFIENEFNEDNECLITFELLIENDESNERTWIANKEQLNRLINNRFNDDLIGVLDQEIQFQINSWGTINKEEVYHEESV